VARIADLEVNEDRLCFIRDRVAMMIPVGERLGEVDNDLEHYLKRLRTSSKAGLALIGKLDARIAALEAERDAALARVAALESVIAAVKSWEAAERAACAASDGLASCDDCHDDCMMTGLRAVLKRVPQ
jgi:hypothetical protein